MAALCAAIVSAVLLASCDITPTSPVLNGNPEKADSREKRPPPPEHRNNEQAKPDKAQTKPEESPAPEKGPE